MPRVLLQPATFRERIANMDKHECTIPVFYLAIYVQ